MTKMPGALSRCLSEALITLALVISLGSGAALGLNGCAGSQMPPPKAPRENAEAAAGAEDPPHGAGQPQPARPPSARPSDSGPPAFTDPAVGLAFPRSLGGLLFRGVQRFGKPELGYGVRYQNTDDLWLDLYVYNLGQAQIPDGGDSAEMRQHFGQAEGDINATAKAGHYTQLVVKPQTRVVSGGRAYLLGTYTYRFRGVTVTSRLYLTGYKNHYVKVRVTWWAAMGTAGESMSDQAVEDVSSLLR